MKIITTYEVAGVSSGGGIGRGLATVHAGLDGSRPVEQAAGWTRRAGWRVYSINKQCKSNRSAKNPESLELLYRRPVALGGKRRRRGRDQQTGDRWRWERREKWKGIISDQKRTGTASFGLLRRDFGRAWGWRVEPSTKVTVGTRKINY